MKYLLIYEQGNRDLKEYIDLPYVQITEKSKGYLIPYSAISKLEGYSYIHYEDKHSIQYNINGTVYCVVGSIKVNLGESLNDTELKSIWFRK